jgi:two-component system, OmpR family, phosphate regulon sensor histidine kinase PhoR
MKVASKEAVGRDARVRKSRKKGVVTDLESPPPAADKRQRVRDLQDASDFHAVLLAMAGHDLRQPLQVILSALSWLARRHIQDQEHEYIERGELAIAQLIAYLDHLVDALRVNERATGVEIVRVGLRSVLGDLCRDRADAAECKGIALRSCATGAAVMSDAVLLDAIVRNLIGNALKYTPAGGKILVGCRRHGPLVHIEVHDTGIGISRERLVRVFDAFHRVDSTRSDGLGLGLFIVRRAAGLVGHRIEVRSAPGRGSCFSVVAWAAS